MFYTPHAEELRAFLRDKLGLSYFDSGDSWLIFNFSDAEIGCHPSEKPFQDISFYCDDIHATVAELRSKGVEFIEDVQDFEWGYSITFSAPGDFKIQLYQPKYK